MLWIAIASWREAELELFQAVRARELYLSDFVSAAIVFAALAFVVRHEALQFQILYLVAAAQNVRYTVLAYRCLVDEREFNGKEKSDKTE